MDEIAGRFLKPSISLTEHNVKYMPRKFRRVYEALHPNDDYDNKETNESKTFLHIGNLNDNYDCYYGTKDTLAAEIICADNPTLVNQFLRNVPNLQYLSLPNNLANQSFKTNAAIDYQDYSNYGNYALQERIRAIKPLDNDRGATFSMRGGTAQPSDHSNQSKKSANNIFIQPGSTESSIARVGEKQKYNMVPAGEVLNNNHITPEIRTCVIKYNNILENLQQEEYLPTNFTNVGLKNLSDTQIDGYKTHPNNNYTYYLFNQEIKAGGTYRLLSASANEEFMGVKSTNDAQISLYKGDDDFLYATSDKDCEISHVTRVKQTGGFNLLPPNDKVKQIVTDYLAKTGDPDSDPEYTAIGHKKYMEELYTSGDGTCRHKVAAVTYKLLMEEVQEEDIRTVRINGNHVKIEIRHNENWIPVELGGSDTEITYDIAGKYSPINISHSAKSTATKKLCYKSS
jgi:hypothetical protein